MSCPCFFAHLEPLISIDRGLWVRLACCFRGATVGNGKGTKGPHYHCHTIQRPQQGALEDQPVLVPPKGSNSLLQEKESKLDTIMQVMLIGFFCTSA